MDKAKSAYQFMFLCIAHPAPIFPFCFSLTDALSLAVASASETADAPFSALSTVTTENPASDVPVVSAAATATGGQEAELKQKPVPGDDDAERGDQPPGISGDDEVVDIAQYEAWQAQQQAMGQQTMQRREETNINIDRHRRELAGVHHGNSEPGDEF